jgi:hypothetical protein
MSDLRAQPQRTAIQATSPTRRWLFTGKLPGQPIRPDRLQQGLARHHISCRENRNSALLDLAGQLPTPLIADLLKLHPLRAAQWTRAAQGDWSDYIAHRSPQP